MCASVGIDAREIKEFRLVVWKGITEKWDEDKSFLWDTVDNQPNKDGNHVLGRRKLAEAVAIFNV